MRASIVTAPGQTQIVELPKPTPGRSDVLVKMRACGICGSDALYISLGGMPPRQGKMPLGHEPAGEVVEVGRVPPTRSSSPLADGTGLICCFSACSMNP